MNKALLHLLEDITDDPQQPSPSDDNKHSRVLLIDSLNLFFRNFSTLNSIAPNGNHIGGLGGFLRSLGTLIKETNPTSVYVVFEGIGSTVNRKNILPEYKSNRHIKRITNWEIFDNLEEELDSKIDQLSRLIQYLKLLPVKTISIDKAEADDVIAYLSKHLVEKYNSQVFIVSNDKDYLQLINENVLVYRPTERIYYDYSKIKEKFQVLPENFILYKTLIGDASDSVEGIKGLGEKGIFKKFPELLDNYITLDDIFRISEEKLEDHITYARVLQAAERLKGNYKIMDLSRPLIDEYDEEYLKQFVEEHAPQLQSSLIAKLYNEDNLGAIIRNLDWWIKENFTQLTGFNK